MRVGFFILATLILVPTQAIADQDIAITVCEEALKARLKAPSTYRQVNANIAGNKVLITYDAVNSFNAPLRGEKVCFFNYKNLHFTLGIQVGSAIYDFHIKEAKRYINAKRTHEAQVHLDAAHAEMKSWMLDFDEGVAAAKNIEGYPIHITRTKLMPGK